MKRPRIPVHLDALAARALTVAHLRANYRPLCSSTDLFPIGYVIRHWLRPSDMHEVVEYRPRMEAGVLPDLPRLTAASYAEQVEIHKALGLAWCRPGEKWRDLPLIDLGQPLEPPPAEDAA